MSTYRQSLVQAAKRAVFRLPVIRDLKLPRYPFMIEPAQLAWLCEALDLTREERARAGGPGCIVEVGVARGQTSNFLLTHMRLRQDTRPYYCIDTFRGFTSSDVDYEVSKRGKAANDLTGFTVNNRNLIEQNLKRQGFANVTTVQCDASTFDWSSLPPIDVMLLDVDLYLPTKATLSNSRARWSPFARIMVDDVKTGSAFDGAHQAYMEICEQYRIAAKLIGTKSGVLLAADFPKTA